MFIVVPRPCGGNQFSRSTRGTPGLLTALIAARCVLVQGLAFSHTEAMSDCCVTGPVLTASGECRCRAGWRAAAAGYGWAVPEPPRLLEQMLLRYTDVPEGRIRTRGAGG
jgi:hypothetical protein